MDGDCLAQLESRFGAGPYRLGTAAKGSSDWVAKWKLILPENTLNFVFGGLRRGGGDRCSVEQAEEFIDSAGDIIVGINKGFGDDCVDGSVDQYGQYLIGCGSPQWRAVRRCDECNYPGSTNT